eukprot:704375-Prorocentrum_minimum.AAC.1
MRDANVTSSGGECITLMSHPGVWGDRWGGLTAGRTWRWCTASETLSSKRASGACPPNPFAATRKPENPKTRKP